MASTVVLGRGDPHSATPAQLLAVVALACRVTRYGHRVMTAATPFTTTTTPSAT